MALALAPAIVASLHESIYFLDCVLANIACPPATCEFVLRDFPRVAQAVAPDFFAPGRIESGGEVWVCRWDGVGTGKRGGPYIYPQDFAEKIF